MKLADELVAWFDKGATPDEILQKWLEVHGQDPGGRMEQFNLLLCICAASNNILLAGAVINHQFFPERPQQRILRNSPLLAAVKFNRVKLVYLLLEKDYNPLDEIIETAVQLSWKCCFMGLIMDNILETDNWHILEPFLEHDKATRMWILRYVSSRSKFTSAALSKLLDVGHYTSAEIDETSEAKPCLLFITLSTRPPTEERDFRPKLSRRRKGNRRDPIPRCSEAASEVNVLSRLGLAKMQVLLEHGAKPNVICEGHTLLELLYSRLLPFATKMAHTLFRKFWLDSRSLKFFRNIIIDLFNSCDLSSLVSYILGHNTDYVCVPSFRGFTIVRQFIKLLAISSSRARDLTFSCLFLKTIEVIHPESARYVFIGDSVIPLGKNIPQMQTTRRLFQFYMQATRYLITQYSVTFVNTELAYCQGDGPIDRLIVKLTRNALNTRSMMKCDISRCFLQLIPSAVQQATSHQAKACYFISLAVSSDEFCYHFLKIYFNFLSHEEKIATLHCIRCETEKMEITDNITLLNFRMGIGLKTLTRGHKSRILSMLDRFKQAPTLKELARNVIYLHLGDKKELQKILQLEIPEMLQKYVLFGDSH